MGPAGIRYVWRQNFDEKEFAASLVGLAVKGRARIIEDDGEFLDREIGRSQRQPLTRGRSRALQDDAAEMTLKQVNHAKVSAV